jgi:hypothetical protein
VHAWLDARLVGAVVPLRIVGVEPNSLKGEAVAAAAERISA